MKAKKAAILERKKSKSRERVKLRKSNTLPETPIPKINTKTETNRESPKLLEQKNGLDTKVPEPEPKPTAPFQSPNTNTAPETELEKIFKEANTLKDYNFDLYKHLKGTLKLKDKQCKDGLTKDSFYCMECKVSTCPKCPLFKVHSGHPIVERYPYYCCDEKLIKENFNDLDVIYKENPLILNAHKVKEELVDFVNKNTEILFQKLKELKTTKLKELDDLFDKTENCVETLKTNIEKMKADLKSFFKKQNKFLCLDVNDNPNINSVNPDANQVLTNLQEGSATGMIQTNKDNDNAVFLISYDLFCNTKNINDEIKYFINDIRLNREKYLTDFTDKKNKIYEDMENLIKPFEGSFNYQFLCSEFYKKIYNKIEKYNEKIDTMKKHVMEKVNQKGTYEDIEKESKVFGTRLNLKFEAILNNQLVSEEEAQTLKSATKGRKTPRKSITKTVVTLTRRSSLPDNEKIYKELDEIRLDKSALQDYFAYEALHVADQNFRLKKKKTKELDEDFDEEVDLAKPVPGRQEILVFDRKARQLVRKTVKFEKNKHKYLNFLTGSRTVLIKDKLYIFGGVDKENTVTKVAYVYYIKTNELYTMPEMLKPHAYHSAQFLDYYKSIIIVGGENSTSCELYDLSTGLWRELPDLKIPRAFCTLYLDKITHIMYAFFGILGKISEKNNNFSDALECLEFRKIALGWSKVDYNNRSEISFRNGINQLLPLNPEMLLFYGGSSMRDFIKRSAVYILPKQEFVKIDNRMFNEIREMSNHSKKLSKILSSTD